MSTDDFYDIIVFGSLFVIMTVEPEIHPSKGVNSLIQQRSNASTEINLYYSYPEDSVYAPCNNDRKVVSMCCAIGPRRGSPDTCYKDDSGLCYNDNGGETVHFWRESCTDLT